MLGLGFSDGVYNGSRLGSRLGLGHNPFSMVSMVELARWPYSVIGNHKTGRILIRSYNLSFQSPNFVNVHGQAALSVFGVMTAMVH